MATASCGNVTVNGYRFFNDSWSSPTYATIAASYCRTGGNPDYVTVDKITLPSFTNAKFVAPYTLSYTLGMARGSQDTQTTSGTLTVHVYTSDPGGESLYSKTPSPTNPPSGYIGSGSLSYSGLNDGYKSFTINNINISSTDLSAGGVYYLWIQTTSLTKVHNSKPSGSLTGTLASFSIKYDANGGSGAPDSQTKIYETDLTLSDKKPTKSSTSSTGYKVTFDTQGGSAVDAITSTKTITYTFSKWNTKSDGSGTSYNASSKYTANAAATLYAQYTSSASNNSIKLPAAPTKTGYTFNGWYTAKSGGTKVGDAGGSYTPTAAVTIWAQWTAKTYGLSYALNGGTVSTANPTSYTIETATFTLKNPTKTGYNFTGWTGTNVTTPQTSVSITKGSTGDRSYTANWDPITYTISYTLDGGTVSGTNPTSYTIETTTFTLKNPTKQNYTFNGWTGSNGTTPQQSVSIAKGSTGNKSYTANWTLNTANYTVKHWQQKVNATSTTNNSTNYAEVTADRETLSGTIGSSVTPAVKTYTGFTSPKTQTVTIKADGSTTVNYYYTRNSYTLTLEKGTGISNVTGGGLKKYDASVSIGATVLTGYTWKNWTGYSTTTTQSYQFNMPANDVTYTANATPITYTVAFNRNGGSYSTMQNQTFTYDAAQKLSKNTFTKSGYSFVGWATSSTGDVVYTDQQEVKNLRSSTGTITLYAVWKQKFTISYNVNGGTGGSISSATVNSGDNHIVSSTILTKTVTENGATATFYHNDGTENYTSITAKDTVTYNLSYWTDNKGNEYNPGATITNVTSNITLTANYEDKKSTTYGNVTAPSNLSRTGYALSGYSIDPGFYTIKRAPNESFSLIADENLYAVWSPNVYNMTIDPNGGQIFNCEAYTSEIINTKFSYNTKTYVGTAIRDKIYGPKISDSTISKTLGTASSSSRFSITIQYASDIEEITSQNDTIALSNPITSSTLTTLTQCQNIFSNGGKYILLDNVVYYVENSNALSQAYSSSSRRYTITCNVHPISIVETGTKVSSYSENNSAIKEGYIFEGYEATAGNVALHNNADFFYFEGENHISNSGRGLVSNGTYVFDGNATNNVTITAKFRKKNYIVQYELNNSKITDQSSFSEVYDYGDTFTLPSFTTTQIYEFLGWNTEADGSGTTYGFGSEVSNLSDVDGATFTLYAQWKLKNLVQIHHNGHFENAQMFVWTNGDWILATTYVWKSGDWRMSTGN